MLPQVANHIFHHTSRAVAAAQNQAGHTLRNVLGFQTGTSQSSTTTLATWNNSTGSSNWGHGHPGAGGGPTFHPGSRFYSGFTQPGRAVVQANTPSTDTGLTYPDDDDEPRLTLPQAVTKSTCVARKHRHRSQSFSLGSDAIATAERAKCFGILTAVQRHARLHHAFAGSHRTQRVLEDVELPCLVRRNSTASAVFISGNPDDVHRSSRPTVPTDPTPLPSVLAPEMRPQSPVPRPRPATPGSTVSSVPPPLDAFEVRAELLKLRQPDYESTVDDWNDVLDKLIALRRHNEQPTEILQTYNDMVTRSILPNARTYTTLIRVLTARDEEASWLAETLSKRIEKRNALGLSDHADNFVDQRRIEALRGEQNFPSALRLFTAASANRAYVLPTSLYIALLDSCARHQNVKAAIRVFTHLEGRGFPKPTASVYAHLLDVYMSINDVDGARVVFDEFRKVCTQGKIPWDEGNLASARAGHIRTWNSMINAYLRAGNPGAALDLLGEMLDTEAGVKFGPKDIPAPAMSTYSIIVRGFCLMGDLPSAISWFERLVDQGDHTKDEWAPTLEPPQPTDAFWQDILNQLGELGRVNDVNRLYARYAARLDSPDQIPIFMRRIAYFTNIRYLQTHDVESEEAITLLNRALSALGPRESWGSLLIDVCGNEATRVLIGMYAKYGQVEKAIDLIEQLAEFRANGATWPLRGPNDAPRDEHPELIRSVSDMVLFDKDVTRLVPLLCVLRIVRVWATRGIHVTQRLALALLTAYALAQKRQDEFPELTTQDWEALAFSITTHGRSMTKDDGVSQAVSLLSDMARLGVDPGFISEAVMQGLLRIVTDQKGTTESMALMENLGPNFTALLASPKTLVYTRPADLPSPHPTSNTAPMDIGTMRIDDYQSRFIDELNMRRGKGDSAVTAFERFEQGAAVGILPTPEVVGRLIEGLGRAGETDKVDYLYGIAQSTILQSSFKTTVLDGWAAIENSMIIAKGHAGDGLSADAHRLRLLQQGMTPTADAYGALIQCVKDTTDDTARALEYFHESQLCGVQPNIFLYNTTISKLAKARKADHALELFHNMKSSGIVPSSITYGAVIAACCRVGDSTSAETLFEEMTTQRNFRPRVPPFNTMMQFYVQTKPNRSRFLYYYNRMISAGIKPTAHSYKLLLDCHGTIAPIDIKEMEKTFTRLLKDRSVTVQGSHWAALINAYGCVGRDLDKAIEVFDSIEKHPSTLTSGVRLPDAVVFEALINVLVTLRRTDLISAYLERLQRSGIHMTAYIANLLIRAYAAAGYIEQARMIFESLADPPVGVAAPNNHAPHDNSVAQRISPNELVYREPSTWEAMVRAELGNGNRDHAIALIRRVQERQYPDSIVSRMSGIMLDGTVSPWSSDPSSEVDTFASSASQCP